MIVKRSSLTILCFFLLSGCVFDPVFDTSNSQTYQDSLAAVKAKLSNEDLRRLDIALKYLAIESTLKAEADVQMASNIGAVESRLTPVMMFTQLRPKINGKSAAAVIKDLSLKLNTEIARAEGRLEDAGSAAGAIEISSAEYYWKRNGRLEQPTIEFAVFNGSKAPISRIYFRFALTTPNRSIPWAKQDFIQTFKGGLEPREKRRLSLLAYGDWIDPQLKNLPNAELKVDVLNFEDANGQRMVGIDRGSLELKRNVRAALQ
jgi:hypothetical protein